MTLQQLIVKPRQKKKNRMKAPKFGLAPHRKGVIYKIAVMSPRKPNSARRTFAKVRLL
jgi:ribosomal protein S12